LTYRDYSGIILVYILCNHKERKTFMHVRFADADERFIQEEVSRGFYVNETELVRDAVRRLREQRQKISPFQAAVMRGVEDIQAGRTSPLTDGLINQLVEDGLAMAKADKPYHSREAIPADE
jgi:antitoxin ParD1/3/4